jgi:hypothetical protein
MPPLQIRDHVRAPAISPMAPRIQYLVARQRDAWFITFSGEEYGPYRTKREAKLFAIEAAHKLGKQGKKTEVLVGDESGDFVLSWMHGQHPYPPRE